MQSVCQLSPLVICYSMQQDNRCGFPKVCIYNMAHQMTPKRIMTTQLRMTCLDLAKKEKKKSFKIKVKVQLRENCVTSQH